MTNLDTLDRVAGRRFSVNALWWRVPVWAAIIVSSTATTHSTDRRVLGATLMVVSVLALQVVRHDRLLVRRASVVLTSVAGLAATLVLPSGLAEIAPAVAASRAPLAFEGTALWTFVVADSLAFAAVIGYISHSAGGVLAGTAVPLLVQRAVEQQALVRERDRARALLVEVQNAREAETEAAAVQERSRIAREMHDVLAHSLAGLSVQLQAVRAVAAKEHAGPALLGPLDKAAALARDGLAEARSAVGALRDPVGLGVDALPALVDRHPGEAALEIVGTPRAIAPETGHALYRAVQESLTNAIRYAPGSPVTVRLEWTNSEVTATVTDTGAPRGRTAIRDQGTGLGLAGMGERITAVGGRLTAGPHGAGWQVVVEVPA